MTDRIDWRKRFVEAQEEAATILDNCCRDALYRWHAWLRQHPGADVETDEAGDVEGNITRDVVMELSDHAVYLLAAHPEVWQDEQVDAPGDAWPDQTLRGAIRLGIASKIDTYIEAHPLNESSDAQRLLDDLKAETLAMFREWARAQPPETVDMHTGNIPEALYEGWKVASVVLDDLSGDEVKQLAMLPEVWKWGSRFHGTGVHVNEGDSLEVAARRVLWDFLMYRAWDWLKESQAAATGY